MRLFCSYFAVPSGYQKDRINVAIRSSVTRQKLLKLIYQLRGSFRVKFEFVYISSINLKENEKFLRGCPMISTSGTRVPDDRPRRTSSAETTKVDPYRTIEFLEDRIYSNISKI